MKGLTARRIGRACALATAIYDSVTIGVVPGDNRYAGPYMIVHSLVAYVGVVFMLFIYTQIKEALQNKKRRTANERVCNCR